MNLFTNKILKKTASILLNASVISATILNTAQSIPVNAETAKEPNLLFVITDQQRFDMLSRAGNKILQTPNMDAIANSGAYFERAYTTCPLCVPARSTILTGVSIRNTKVIDNNIVNIAKLEDGIMIQQTFDEILLGQGYYSAYLGKWHAPIYRATNAYDGFRALEGKNGLYASFQLDYNIYLKNAIPKRELEPGEQMEVTMNVPYKPDPIDKLYGQAPGNFKDASGKDIVFSQEDEHGELMIPADKTMTAYTVDTTIDTLKKAKESGKPFNITCSIKDPHPPQVLPAPYYEMYPTSLFTPPKSINDPKINFPYTNMSWSYGKNPEYADSEKIKYMMSNYYGMVKQDDDNLGRLIQGLKDIGEYDNTMIVFTSDHGEMLGAHGMREKSTFFEEALHIPLFISFPGKIKSETVVSDPVSQLDIFATIMDYMEAGKHISEGKSLRSLIEGTSTQKYVVSEWGKDNVPTLCVVTNDWKLMVSTKEGILSALYDEKNDPEEMNNLIGTNPDREKYRDVVETLKGYLMEYLTSVKHPLTDIVNSGDVVTGKFNATNLAKPVVDKNKSNINQAKVLYDLGLFQGMSSTEFSPALEKTLTREQAIKTILMILGKGQEALDANNDCPFTDVSEWAKPYVSYAYANGITKGISGTTFGAMDDLTGRQLLTFYLRALGYEETGKNIYDTAQNKAMEIGLIKNQLEKTTVDNIYIRNDLVRISYNALLIQVKGTDKPLIKNLVDKEIVSMDKLKNSQDKGLILLAE